MEPDDKRVSRGEVFQSQDGAVTYHPLMQEAHRRRAINVACLILSIAVSINVSGAINQ